MLDPIAEMLTRLRNAQMAGHKEVEMSASKLKLAIAKILEREGFVEDVIQLKDSDSNFDKLKVVLKYYKKSNTEKLPAIKGLRRISKEGQRIYVGKSDIRKVKNGYGIGIISTSKGIMTDQESKMQGLGGEYICEVW